MGTTGLAGTSGGATKAVDVDGDGTAKTIVIDTVPAGMYVTYWAVRDTAGNETFVRVPSGVDTLTVDDPPPPAKPTVPVGATATLTDVASANLSVADLGALTGNGTVHWAVYATSVTPADEDDVKAGTTGISGGNGDVAYSDVIGGTAGAFTADVAGIVAGIDYSVYLVFTATNSVGSTDSDLRQVSGGEITAIDGTLPTFTTAPAAGTHTASEVKYTVTLDEAGTIFSFIQLETAGDLGLTHAAVSGADGVVMEAATAGSSQTITIDMVGAAGSKAALTASTEYEVFVSAADTAGNPIAAAVKVDATTEPATPTIPTVAFSSPTTTGFTVTYILGVVDSDVHWVVRLASVNDVLNLAAVRDAVVGTANILAEGTQTGVTVGTGRTFTVTGLPPAKTPTAYEVLLIAVSTAVGNTPSALVEMGPTSTIGDSSAPVFAAGPTASASAPNQITLGYTAPIDGEVAYVVVASWCYPTGN